MDFGISEIMMGVMAAMSAAGTGLSVASQVQQSKAAAKAAEYNAQAITQGPTSDVANIDYETTQQVQAETAKNKEIRSKQLAMAAASGVDPEAGSSKMIDLNNAYEGALNELRINYSGELKKQGAYKQAALYGQQARNYNAQTPWLVAGGALQGAGSLARQYYAYKSPGLINSNYGSNYGLGTNYDTSV
jgi:hypothetical protein